MAIPPPASRAWVQAHSDQQPRESQAFSLHLVAAHRRHRASSADDRDHRPSQAVPAEPASPQAASSLPRRRVSTSEVPYLLPALSVRPRALSLPLQPCVWTLLARL